MANTNNEFSNNLRPRAGVRKMIKHTLKIDMTPMVDLGFLLISFFVITTELSKPTVMKLNLPTDGPPTPLGRSDALTLLLDKNNTIFFYYGDWKEAVSSGAITRIAYSGTNGLRNLIERRQKWLAVNSKSKEGRDGLMMIIKASAGASYKNLVDVLDEATISMVKKYTVVKISPEETEWLGK
ncbi:MAG: biopolymer transporter ExbD [Chitinophagaceae bacterium]